MNDCAGKFVDYYQLLGVDTGADGAAIKRAYLNKVKEWHPDKNPDRSEAAGEKTKVLNQAYHILGDAERRKHYDRMIRFTRGKNVDDYLNDETVRDKLDQAYPYFRNVLENVRRFIIFRPAGGSDPGFYSCHRISGRSGGVDHHNGIP